MNRSSPSNAVKRFPDSSSMATVTSSEFVRHFSAIIARVAAGEELTVTHYRKPVLRMVQIAPVEAATQEREALVRKALSFRMTRRYGKKFKRLHAYDA